MAPFVGQFGIFPPHSLPLNVPLFFVDYSHRIPPFGLMLVAQIPFRRPQTVHLRTIQPKLCHSFQRWLESNLMGRKSKDYIIRRISNKMRKLCLFPSKIIAFHPSQFLLLLPPIFFNQPNSFKPEPLYRLTLNLLGSFLTLTNLN